MAKRRTLSWVGLIVLSSFASTAWAGDPYKSIARKFSRSAEKAGVQRLAVLPFIPMDGSSSSEGINLSECLTTRMARYGRLQVVERRLLKSLLSEHRLGQTGMLDGRDLARIGRMLQAQAVVTGSFITLGNTVQIQARLVHIETGVIIAARRVRFKRNWFPNSKELFSPSSELTVEGVIAEVAAFRKGIKYMPGLAPGPSVARHFKRESDLRDAVAGYDCAAADQRINELEESILGLKTRYWARQARKRNFPRERLKKVGSRIPDPQLRARFYQLLSNAIIQNLPPLTPYEVKRFTTADSEAFILNLSCGS